MEFYSKNSGRIWWYTGSTLGVHASYLFLQNYNVVFSYQFNGDIDSTDLVNQVGEALGIGQIL